MSLRTTTSWLMIAGSMTRNACGSSTIRIVWPLVSPIASAASRWPRGSDATPARTTSAKITML